MLLCYNRFLENEIIYFERRDAINEPSIQGLSTLLKQFANLENIDIETAALAGSYKFQSLAQSREDFPVQTGALRANVTSEKISGGATTTFNQEYAYLVEMGTSKMQARSYARTTIDEHQADILSVVKDNIEQQIKDKNG